MRYIIIVIVGLVLAAGVTFALKSKDEPEVQANDGEKVLVAKVDLTSGKFLVAATDINLVDMDPKDIKPNYIQKKNANMADLDGAVIRSFIKTGEPLEKDKIVTPKEGGFLSAVLQPGKRAISVGVDVVSANAGFVFPGDHVDLLLTHEVDLPAGGKSYASETFVEDVRVLAIDQQVNNPDHKTMVPKTVTLEVTPKQAEEVLVAEELGKISLILRSLGSVTFNPVTDVETKTYTKDNEVSKVLDQYRPDNNFDVTVTRGKASLDTKVNAGPDTTQPGPIMAPSPTTAQPYTSTKPTPHSTDIPQ